MGAWGYRVWENDEGADWLAHFMRTGVDTRFILQEAEAKLSEPCLDDFDEVRAIGYVIAVLGNRYIWPSNELDRVRAIKLKLIDYLQQLLEADSDFMELWEGDSEAVNEVRKEIEALKEK